MSDKNMREHPRASVDLAVKMRSGGEAWAGNHIKNISLGGVFVAGDRLLSFGSELELEFSIPGAPSIKCKGLVIWTTKQYPDRGGGSTGMGLRLSGLSVADMRQISLLVKEQLETAGAA
jgi:uncharacterized protein (TIGR02266 family)